MVKIYLGSSLYLKVIAVCFCYGDISVSMCHCLDCGFTPFSGYHFPKEWYLGAPEMTLYFFGFRFSQWYIYITCIRVLTWSQPSASYSAIKMSCAIPKTAGISLNISELFCWNMSPVGLVPLQMVVWWICTCQIGMQAWLIVKFFYWVWGCGKLSLHQ